MREVKITFVFDNGDTNEQIVTEKDVGDVVSYFLGNSFPTTGSNHTCIEIKIEENK